MQQEYQGYGNYTGERAKQPEFFVVEQDIMQYCFHFLQYLLSHSQSLYVNIAKFAEIEKLLVTGLLQSDNILLKLRLAEGLTQIVQIQPLIIAATLPQ